MSEQQLKRAIQEKEKAQDELNRCKTIIKVSEACTSLQTYVKETPDPLTPEWTGENPWRRKQGGGCSII